MRIKNLDSDFLQYLADNNLPTGTVLPTLKEISVEMGISVGKLREQSSYARAIGVISARPRVGMRRESFNFGTAATPAVLFSLATAEATFEQLSSLRCAVETSFWHSATALLTPNDIADLQQIVDDAQARLHEQHIPHELHCDFHLGLFKRMDNPFATGILETYWAAYIQSEVTRYMPIAYWEEVWDYHRNIVNAIESNNIDQACQILIDHFNLLKTTPSQTTSNGRSF